MKPSHNKIGQIGESIACKYLEGKGFKVIERNYNRKWGEIDIICHFKKKKLHFVEVKSVSRENVSYETPDFRPEEKVDDRKRARLKRAIETYMLERNVPHETDFQIDLLVVFLNPETKQARVESLENIIL